MVNPTLNLWLNELLLTVEHRNTSEYERFERFDKNT